MKTKIFISLIILNILVVFSKAWSIDIAAQYHVNYKRATCPTSNPTADWWHWDENQDFPGRNACNFIGGTTWLRDTNTVTYPLIGPYGNVGNPAQMYRWHIRAAKAAGIDAFLVSVFPGASAAENTELMGYFLDMLQIAQEENFKLGLEMWIPLGGTTPAQYYARAQSNIDTANASAFASALYKINNLPVVWIVFWTRWDSLANLRTGLLNTRQAYWIISGDLSISELNSMSLSNGASKTQAILQNHPTTSGCVANTADISNDLNIMGSNGYGRVSHTFPRFNESQNVSNERVCLTGSTNTLLTTWYNESVAGAADLAIIESWNDFREMTAIEPGFDIITWRNSGQEQVYFGDPYYPLKHVATLQGITYTTPQLRCSIVDGVLVSAGITNCVGATNIARTGSCAAAGTSCNLSSVTPGDLVLTFAYRSGSTQAPGAAANNTSIRTGQTSGGGGAASYRLSCRRAGSSGETGSGTFTNATGVVSIAYEGTNVNATADCQTSGVGARGATGNGVNWAKNSTTVSYQSLALQKTDNTAWVVGFMGGSSSAVCSPTSLTNRSSAGVVRASDSNATVTSFSTATCGVSSETWMSETLEILPVPVPPAGDTQPPSVPGGLNLAVISTSQINLSWTASTDNVGVTEYRVERCQGVGCSNFLEIENPISNSYNDTGLQAETSYTYKIRASDLVGNLSGYSISATAVTQSVPVGGGGLVQSADLVALGNFKLPAYTAGFGDWNYAGGDLGAYAITYNPASNSIFIGGHPTGGFNPIGQTLGEVAIPASFTGTPTTTVLQNLRDALEGHLGDINPGDPNQKIVGSSLVVGSNLYIGAYAYYDGSGSQVLSYFKRPVNLSTTGSVTGPYRISPQYQGWYDKYISHITSDWQSALGGPQLMGGSGGAVASLQSWGPSASVVNIANLGTTIPLPATLVLGYPIGNELGSPTVGNTLWSQSSVITGMAQIANTRTLLFVGRHGQGNYCYGPGTTDPSLHGKPVPPENIDTYCYDPDVGSKGVHNYPYRAQAWAYDLNDLLKVKAGQLQSYEVQPYAVWDLGFASKFAGGLAYDSANQRLYISEALGDGTMPVIHAYSINTTIVAPPTNVAISRRRMQ